MINSLVELRNNDECIQGSFIYALHEEDCFDERLYWKFYNSVLELSIYFGDKEHDPQITRMIIHTHNYFLKSLIWSYSPNDASRIKNLPHDKLHLYVERLCVRVEYGYFERQIVDEEGLNEDLMNPYYELN
ncbi:Imm41 family immunity protein [Paenibacillus sp. YPG26]|uniref:Imm41 family immunity protein n=1 Tax=Paenibacillus sp. YPG26 TaxID=2878915 RepID=UPI002041EEBF|nr:Imm41 family immunity protein [Paenibacillus sp. YPG26]USB33374.1 immunity 41 family protein [Paenibacillus sp. YPG26]